MSVDTIELNGMVIKRSSIDSVGAIRSQFVPGVFGIMSVAPVYWLEFGIMVSGQYITAKHYYCDEDVFQNPNGTEPMKKLDIERTALLLEIFGK